MAKTIILKIDEISTPSGNTLNVDDTLNQLNTHDHDVVYYQKSELDQKITDLDGEIPSTFTALGGVNVTGVADNQLLSYDGANSEWKNINPPDTAIATAPDANLGAAANGQLLMYSSADSKWGSADMPEGGITIPSFLYATQVDGHGLASIVFQGGGLYDAGTLGSYKEKSVADDSEAFADTFSKSSSTTKSFNSSDGTYHYELGVAHINWKYSFSSKSAVIQAAGSMPMSLNNAEWSNWCMAAHTFHIGLGATEANTDGQNHKYQYSGNSFSLLSLSAYDLSNSGGAGVVHCGGADGFVVRDHHVASAAFKGIWRFDPNNYSRSQITPPAGYETSGNVNLTNSHAITTPLTDGYNLMLSGGFKTGKRKMYSVSGGAWSDLSDNPVTGTQMGKGASTGPVAFHQNQDNVHLYKHQFDTGAGAVELQNLCHSPVKWGAHMAAGT